MLFNSIGYAFFLPVVFAVYWLLNRGRLVYQNLFLLLASYFFYSCWDWRFVFLLILSTALDYFTGEQIHRANTLRSKRIWLTISLVINLGILAFFKYYNFFIGSFSDISGINANSWMLQIILPIGVSFYTFHGISYVVDIYRARITPEKNFVTYALFVSFFPLLVAGPIERATHLLPQLKVKRKFEYTKAVDGLRQILWGLFVKMVVADNCASWVNAIYANDSQYSGSTLMLGAFLFAFQVYGDFSAYSDIALGTAKLFGIDLMRNFNFPYLSRNIAEFWKRNHISLTTWFRDYLYIPLGGSRNGMAITVRNCFIVFIVSGFWHGGKWNFIVWGAAHALYFLPLLLLGRTQKYTGTVAEGRTFPSLKDSGRMLLTFYMNVMALILFRAESLTQAVRYIRHIFTPSMFTLPDLKPREALFFILIFILAEWHGRTQGYALANVGQRWARGWRWLLYCAMGALIVYYSDAGQPFIYFQF